SVAPKTVRRSQNYDCRFSHPLCSPCSGDVGRIRRGPEPDERPPGNRSTSHDDQSDPYELASHRGHGDADTLRDAIRFVIFVTAEYGLSFIETVQTLAVP